MKEKKYLIMAVLACAILISGGVFLFSRYAHQSGDALVDVVFPKACDFDDYEAKNSTITSNPIEDIFLTEVNQFSYKTASQIITSNNGNLNYSPLSLYYALALATSGTNGETAEELLSLLGAPNQNALSVQCGNLYRRLYTNNKIGKLNIGNSIWMDKSIKWKDSFIKNAAKNFYASSFSVDFSDDNAGKNMAKWIASYTNNIIQPEMNISPEQIMSIVNTVYFYDEWVDRFNKEKTAEDVFSLSDGSNVNCDFMNTSYASSAFTKGNGFTRSSLSLKNSGQMVFILPDEGVSPRELLSTPEKAKAVFEEGKDGMGEVVWKIPKFSIESKLDFSATLKALGINCAFRQDADFSGITDERAYISSIYQETHIGIDENGVEAAAFTQIGFAGASLPDGRADMILNRPFIYAITASDGTLLFMGVCDNPVVK